MCRRHPGEGLQLHLLGGWRLRRAGRSGQSRHFGVPADEAVSEADTAMALLSRAVSIGQRITFAFRAETALHPLSGRDDFRALLMDFVFPADLFARGR